MGWAGPLWDKVFQSTPPCGGRHEEHSRKMERLKFQSTPPCGGRQGAALLCTSYYGFNPRPRAGGDNLQCLLIQTG